MKHLYLGFHILFFARHDRSPCTARFWWRGCGVRQKPEIPHCSHRRPFRAKAYVIRNLLLCDWSFQQTSTKPQTQWKGMLFGCEQPFLWVQRCVTSQKTAAEETKPIAALLRNVFSTNQSDSQSEILTPEK